MRRVQIFISSPGDVQPERVNAERVIRQLTGRYAALVAIEPVLWENRVYDANRSFQEQIAAIREMDVVVGILWKRVGSELPPDRFRRDHDGSAYESGTAFELEAALACNGQPPVYVFKKTSPILFTKEGFEEEKRQSDLLDKWWNRTFHDEQRHFLRGYEPFATEEAFEARLTLALQGWLEAENLVPRGPIWDIEKKSPFPGLEAYDRDRASVFFGRALATGEAIERLLDHTGRPGRQPVLFIIGASGSGKSSLARAGIVPWLTTPGIVPGIDNWRTVVIEPSSDVMARLAETLFEALPALATGPHPSPDTWRKLILSHPRAAGETVRWAIDRLEPTGRSHSLLLLLDQLETLLADPNQTTFAASLNSLLETARVWVVATLRTDRYAVLQQEPMLSLKRGGVVFDLPPPGPAEIAEIVRGSERAAGLAFEEEAEGKDGQQPRSLADELVAATPNADALPLLQMSLARLFASRQGTLLRLDELDAMGGVPGAIAAHADEVFKKVSGTAQGQLRQLVAALTSNVARRADHTIAFTTRVADAKEFEPTPARRELVDAFVEARLLVRDNEGALRVAHEAILRRWQDGYEALEAIADAELRRARARQFFAVAAAVLFIFVAAAAALFAYSADQAQRQADQQRMRALDLARLSMAGEWLDRDATKAALILSEMEDPENARFAARRFGEVLRLPLVYIELEHDAPATLVSFSPDGKLAVSATDANTVRVWNVETGAPLTELLSHDSSVTAASISPDGTVVVSTAGDNALLWEVATSRKRFTWPHQGSVTSASFHPSGKFVVTSAGGTVWLWDVQFGGTRFAEPWRHGDEVTTASFSPDGRLVFTGSKDGFVRVWNMETGEEQFEEPWQHSAEVTMALSSPDGKLVLTTWDDGTARIWDLETGKEKSTFEARVDLAWFSPDNELVVTATGDTARVWNAGTGGEQFESLSHAPSAVVAAGFTPDGKLLTVSGHRYFTYWDPPADNMVRAWDLRTGELRFAKPLRHDDEVLDASFSPDGKWVATRSGKRHGAGRMEELRADSTVRVWNLETEGERFALRLHGASPSFSPDGTLVVTVSGKTAQLWDVETGRQRLAEPLAHEQHVSFASFSPDGKLVLTISGNGAVQLWDVETGRKRFSEPLSSSEPVNLGLFSVNGELLMTEHLNNTVQVWDVETGGSRFPEPLKFCGAPTRPSLSPDGKLLVSACGETAHLWNVETGEELFPGQLRHDRGYVRSISFSPDGKLVLTASDDGTARIWNVATGDELRKIEHDRALTAGGPYGLSGASFSPDGKRVLTTSTNDGTARIWDAETRNEQNKFPNGIGTASFIAEGRLVVTHSPDNNWRNSVARVWDADSGTLRMDIPIIGGGLSSSPSLASFGRYLVTWYEESARVWDLETGEELFAEPLSHPKSNAYYEWSDDVRIAILSPDGNRLLTATDDETRIWLISGELLRSALRSATTVCLSQSFRQLNLGESHAEARTNYEACSGEVPVTDVSERHPSWLSWRTWRQLLDDVLARMTHRSGGEGPAVAAVG